MADTTQTETGFGILNPAANAPVGPAAWQLSEQRRLREEKATAGDYIGSIWRQDGLVDGLVATLAGQEMLPLPGYFAGTDPQWEHLKKDLWDDHVKELYGAASPAHALFLKDRLLQKQEDLLRLGDMGFAGNAGRLALNVVSPDALLMSMAGGWVTRGIQGVNTYRATRAAASQLGRADAGAGIAAEAAVRASKAPAVAGGIAFGAAENAAYEALRQSVSFEDDSAATVEAGLMGALLTAPFALAGVRQNRRVAEAAQREHAVLGALKKVEDGAALSPGDVKILKDTHDIHVAVRDLEAGRIDEAEFEARMGEVHGPFEPAEQWARRHAERVRADARSIIDELFPNRGEPTRAVPKSAPSEMPASQAEIAAANGANPVLAGSLKSAFKVTLEERARLRKAFDLEQAQAAADASRAAEREAAFARAEADRAAALSRDHERMVNAREEARMLADEDPLVQAAEQAGAPAPAREDAALAQAPAAADAQSFVGKDVSWADPKTGDTFEGRVTRVSPTGKLVVETPMGEYKAVSHELVAEHLDQYSGRTPEGFLPGSVGAAQIKRIVDIAQQRTAMSRARLDYFAILNRSDHAGVRELAFKLIKDAIQVDGKEAQGWTASEHKKHIQRVVGGNFHRVLDQALSEAIRAALVPILQRSRFKTDFYTLVSRATRPGGQAVLAANPTIAPMLTQASAAMKEAYARVLGDAQAAGVKGAQNVPANDLYVNRMWDFARIREMELAHGQDALVDLIANAIKVPKYAGDRAKARRFLETIKKLEFSAGLQSVHLQGRDMHTLRSELARHNLAPDEIDDLVDLLFDARSASGGDAGQTGNLRFRFDLDESMSLRTAAGELRLDNLFENDARVLIDTYLNSMAGHIGLARAGITSKADWDEAIKEIQDAAAKRGGVDGSRLKKELGYLDDMYANITGRPMSTADFSNSARTMQALRGYTRSVMLGQLGLTAAFEMNRAVAIMGFKAVWQSLPSFRGFFVALRQGYIPEPGLAEDVLHMTGFGNEMASSYARAHELESGYVGGALTRVERGANAVSHVSDVLSGNASFTSITRQMSAMAAIRNAFDFAVGKKTLTPALRERWVGQGVDDMDIDSMLYDLKRFSTERNGVLQSIRYEDWSQQASGSYQRFQLLLSRQVRDAIQDHDIGETMPFVHTTVGKILGELRTFMLVAHAKNFLKNLEYRDATALQMYLIAFVSESMAYATQAAINYPEELDERLSPERIASSAMARMSINGLAPLLAESAFNMLSGGNSLFQPGATANTDSRVLWKTPSYMVATRLWNTPALLSGMAGADTTTSREFEEGWRALPMSRLYGMPALGSYFADTFPKTDPEAGR
jgi:hypothetical protein